MEDQEYTDVLPMEEGIPEDSGIGPDSLSLESAEGTITPDRPGSECESDHDCATLVEVDPEEVENLDLDKAVGNLEVANTEPVHVMDRDGKTMILALPPETLVRDILQRAAYEDDVPDSDSDRYRLMYGNRILEQGKTLSQQGIPRGSILRLEDEMDLNVQGLDGRKYQVRARPSTTVEEFRRQLQRESGIQPAEQRITCNGKTLVDGKKLRDFKIKNGASMQLVTRFHSG